MATGVEETSAERSAPTATSARHTTKNPTRGATHGTPRPKGPSPYVANPIDVLTSPTRRMPKTQGTPRPSPKTTGRVPRPASSAGPATLDRGPNVSHVVPGKVAGPDPADCPGAQASGGGAQNAARTSLPKPAAARPRQAASMSWAPPMTSPPIMS